MARGQQAIAVGRDGRLSGPALAGALADGIRAAGVDVIDIGCVPTPMTYFAAYHLGTDSCVSVTGSHNPPDYNGLKMVLGGQTLYGDADPGAAAAHRRRQSDATGAGRFASADVVDAYIERIVSRRQAGAADEDRRWTAATAWPGRSRRRCSAGWAANWSELFCEVDGNFPNHHPDPSKPENLRGRDPRRCARPTPSSAWPSTATATGSAW